jgi:hypothetical protein
MAHSMSEQEFRIDGNTKLKLSTGNQGAGKVIISDNNGTLDWSTFNSTQDGWTYTNNIITSGQGTNIITLSPFTHHMVVNNQNDTDYGLNKVRFMLPVNQPTFTKIRITLMSEPWEVYVGSTASPIAYNSLQGTTTPSLYTRGPVSLSTWTPSTWFPIKSHNTIEFTRFYYAANLNITTRDNWIITSVQGDLIYNNY